MEKNKKDRTHTWRLWNFHGGLEERGGGGGGGGGGGPLAAINARGSRVAPRRSMSP